MSLVPIHFYGNIAKIKFTSTWKTLIKRIEEIFPSIVYNQDQYELSYYSETNQEKKVINDQNSAKEFMKEYKNSATKKHFLNIIDLKYEHNLISKSNIAESIYKSEYNPKQSDSMSKIGSSIMQTESIFVSNASKIFEKVSDIHQNTIKTQLEDQLTLSFMKTPIESVIVDLDNYLDCKLCSQKILTHGYYRCLDCDFNICKDCYFRFQDKNFHPHDLIYAIQKKEDNIVSTNKKKTTNKIDYKYEEIEDFISKAEPRFEDEDEYLCEVIEKDEVFAKYDDQKKENLYDVKVTYKNLGSKIWKENVTFRKVLERDKWFIGGRNLMFEYVVSKKPYVNPNEIVTINFKINAAGKPPGDYFCVLGLKRGDNYIIKGSICVFKIHINLVADDYS